MSFICTFTLGVCNGIVLTEGRLSHSTKVKTIPTTMYVDTQLVIHDMAGNDPTAEEGRKMLPLIGLCREFWAMTINKSQVSTS